MKQTFVIGGQEFSLSADDVERRLKGVEPEKVRKVFVEVSGKRFPIKQALAVAALQIRSGFTTQDALRIFRKLGFKLGEQ